MEAGMDKTSQLESILRDLFQSQRLAVLATQSKGQPYSCLVAFAVADDLKHLVFATHRDTRKYQDLNADPRVSVLVDSRSNRDSDFRDALAVTATGRAEEVKGDERDRLLGVYLAKHPRLGDFAGSLDSALVRVVVEDYVVSSFQNVATLRPE